VEEKKKGPPNIKWRGQIGDHQFSIPKKGGLPGNGRKFLMERIVNEKKGVPKSNRPNL